jgi:ankyrin repeat protein
MSINLSELHALELRNKYHYLFDCELDSAALPSLIASFVDPNGDKLIHIAAGAGDVSSVELLLDAGENIDALGDMDCTPLHYAKMNGRDKAVEMLVERGASKTIRNRFGQLPDEA